MRPLSWASSKGISQENGRDVGVSGLFEVDSTMHRRESNHVSSSAALGGSLKLTGPNIAPIVYTRGIILNARGCNSWNWLEAIAEEGLGSQRTFHGQSSATVVLKMPTLPFPSPCSARAVMAIGRLVEKPHINIVTSVLHRPIRIIGFLPKRSEAAPQGIPVKP